MQSKAPKSSPRLTVELGQPSLHRDPVVLVKDFRGLLFERNQLLALLHAIYRSHRLNER